MNTRGFLGRMLPVNAGGGELSKRCLPCLQSCGMTYLSVSTGAPTAPWPEVQLWH